VQFCHTVHLADKPFQLIDFFRRHQVGLVQQDDVGKSDLLLNFIIVEMLPHVLGINHRDNAIQSKLVFQLIIEKEGLDNRSRIGQAGGLDENIVESIATFNEVAQDANQVAAYGAAQATVVHLKDFFFGADDEFLIDADFAEFIFNNGDALTVMGVQNVVQKSRLARAKKPCQNGDGNSGIFR
jgi:hypothetical protein